MIGTMRTTHPVEGCAVIVRYKRVGSRVTILAVSDASGKDIFGQMSSEILQHFKRQIKSC